MKEEVKKQKQRHKLIIGHSSVHAVVVLVKTLN